MSRHYALIISLAAGATPICTASPSSYLGGFEQSIIDDNGASEVSASAPLRALARSGNMCEMAMQAVPAAAWFGIMPAKPAMLNDKDLYCSIMRVHGNMNSDGSEKTSCSGKTAAQCYNGCQWNSWQSTCQMFDTPMMLSLVNPDAGSPAKTWMSKMVACNKLSKSACATNNCTYKDDESKCDVSTAALRTITCATSGSVDMFQLYLTCSAISTKESCTGQCAYKEDRNKCDMNPLVAYKMFFGAAGGAKLDAMGVKTSTCSNIGTNMTKCQANPQCKVGLLGCELAMHPVLKTEMDACKVHAQSNCTAAANCSWNSNTKLCDVHPQTLGLVCGWQSSQSASGSSQHSMAVFFLLVTASAASIAASLMQA